MNKTISLAAIAMVAVIMGMSAFAPDAFAKQNKPHVVDDVCHFDRDVNNDGDITTDDMAWIVLSPNTHGAQNGHVNGHGDKVVITEGEAFWCVDNQDGTIVDPNPA